MSYLIDRNESAAAGLRRVLAEQHQKALVLLQAWHRDPPGHVHRARQCFKRARAIVGLARGRQPYVYRVEDATYRDLGRALSFVRDTQAMVEAIDILRPAARKANIDESVVMLRQGLKYRADFETDRLVEQLAGPIGTVTAQLNDAGERIPLLPLRGIRRRHLKRAARKTVRRCRDEFIEVTRDGRAEVFHEWRKRAKRAYYHARLMQSLMPEFSARYARPLESLAALLGQSQDLYVLDEFLRQQPDALQIDTHVHALRRLIHESMGRMHADAVRMGSEVFAIETFGGKSADVIRLDRHHRANHG